MKNSISLSV